MAGSAHDLSAIGLALGGDHLDRGGHHAIENRSSDNGITEDFMIPLSLNALLVEHSRGVA
jgi:hypothetical protein